MEFFGSRAAWTQMRNITDTDALADIQENEATETVEAEPTEDVNRLSTSHELDAYPNEIEFEK